MKTILDDFHTTFLHSITYIEEELRLVIAEGIRSEKPENTTILGQVINTHELNITENSRQVEIRFIKPIVWQSIQEQFTCRDDYEISDDKCVLQEMTRSRYLDFVRENHGWFEIVYSPGKHYRVWTEWVVIDIVACGPPVVAVIHSENEPWD